MLWLADKPYKATIFVWFGISVESYLAGHITRPCYKIGCFVCIRTDERKERTPWRTPGNELPRTNSGKRTQKNELRRTNWEERVTRNESGRKEGANNWTNVQNEFGLLRSSYGYEHSVRELLESMLPNRTNGRVPSQTIKGGLAKRPLNSLTGPGGRQCYRRRQTTPTRVHRRQRANNTSALGGPVITATKAANDSVLKYKATK